jgi:hypothetical protein
MRLGPAAQLETAKSLYTEGMRRMPLGLLLLIAAALPLRAEETPASAPASAADANKDPILVNPDAVRTQADQLNTAVASPSVDNYSVHSKAAGFFENVQRQTPLVRPDPRRMDREPVDGHVGTIDGMIATAKVRYDHYRMTTTEVPSTDLENAVGYAKVMRDDKRADFNGKMAENQMGEFVYAVKDRLDAGKVEINARMALIATRIGEAFAYATLAHEAAHAKARADGRLTPERVIDGELEAYRVQYRWLKVIDPSAERIIVMHSTLGLHLKRHPEDQVTRASISYLEHLLQLWDTGGEDGKLRDMIKKLGYEEGEKNLASAESGPRV